MNMQFQQSTRLGRLTTSLGDDELALVRFSGTELVNSLFEYRVEAISKNDDIDFDDLIGKHATVEIDHPDHGAQTFDGIVTRARYVGPGSGGYRYDLELRPWLWLTGKRRNQQIFHRMSVVEILHDLWEPYADLGSPALEMHLSKEYPELEYTVQFAESDLDFACRMMERFGISYFFKQDDKNHVLMLIDSPGALNSLPGTERPYYSAGAHTSTETERFSAWRTERNMTTGAIKLTDYDFKNPGARMFTQRRGDAKYSEAFIESYDWPGRYKELSRGEEAEIGLRVDQERGQDRRTFAEGNCLSLRAGHKVRLSGDKMHSATGETFICLSANHAYVSNAYGSGEAGSSGNDYTGNYTLMPENAPLAPRRKTPLAIVQGPHTATVVGDGEIDCDEHGRILVRFHWDLEHAFSMRCRVSQSWAGNGWGGMIIPRVGMEVVVEFLDGDPDKPLVTGCVYNGRNKAPYALPEHKTKSVFRSDTHQGKGFNEINFEDANGNEQIFIHAEMDKDIIVQNDLREWVKNDAHHRVDGNRTEDIKKDKSNNVGANRIDATSKTHSATVGKDSSLSVGKKYSVVAGESVFLQAAKATVLESKGDLVIKTPSGFIKFSGDGITIRGTKVNINSGGSDFSGVVGEGLSPAKPDKARVKD